MGTTARDMSGFKLGAEHLKKLGLNEDYTQIEGYVPPTELGYDSRENEIIEPIKIEEPTVEEKKPEAEPEKKPEETKVETKEEPVSQEQQIKTEPEEKLETDKKTETTAQSPLDEFTQKLTDVAKAYQTPEERNQLLKDLENRDKFFATVTQKSQSLAAEKKVFDDMVEAMGYNAIREFLSNEEFMETLDRDWFDGKKENNPLRKLPEVYKHIEEKSKQEQEDFDKEMDRQVNQLKTLDKKYESFDEILKLSEIADKKGVNLLIAHELQQSNLKGEAETTTLKKTVTDHESKIAELNKALEKAQGELQERNNELSEIRKTGVIKPIINPGASGSAAKNESLDLKPAVGFDKKSTLIKKRLGVG